MLEQTLVRERPQEQAAQARTEEATIPVEQVLQLFKELESADMLKGAITPPGRWILLSEVAVDELASTLHQHLSKRGWRCAIEAMHRHNRRAEGPLWDLARPADLLAAVEGSVERSGAAVVEPADDAVVESAGEEQAQPATVSIDEWTPDLKRQVKSLMQEQLAAVGITDWLLSPHALVTRLNTRARRAQAETQIEAAVSEAALHAVRMVGTDTERDVALKRVEQLREKLADQLQVFCAEHGLPLPEPYSREEAYCLHLLNAYFVALAEAEGVIARRGAALARRQINLEGERAEAKMDGRLLPGLVEARMEINPLRESMVRERMRHKLAVLVGGVFGAVTGGLWAIVESVSEVLIERVARHAVIVAPAFLVGLMTLVAQTLAYRGVLTLAVVAQFLARALWNGSLALGATILIYGCWLFYIAEGQGGEAEILEPHAEPES
jgi:hypothetical protein